MRHFTIIFVMIMTVLSMPVHAAANGGGSKQDSTKLKKILKEIARQDVFDLDVEEASNQEQLYERLLHSGSKFDFLKLAMDQKDPLIRVYAFKAIAETMDDLPAELVTRFKQDQTVIRVRTDRTEKELPVREVINGFLK